MNFPPDENELKPCPFCGCVSVFLSDNHPAHIISYFVECKECQATGPFSSNKNVALNAWQNRFEAKDEIQSKSNS